MGRDLEVMLVFFYDDTATTEIYSLSLHGALPVLCWCGGAVFWGGGSVLVGVQ